MSWSVEAATAGRDTGMPSLRASSATAATCGRASVWPSAEPASRCSASSSGSAATSRPAVSSRPRTGRGSDGALATAFSQALRAPRDRPGRVASQLRAVRDVVVAHAVEDVRSRVAGSSIPSRSPIAAKQTGRKVARCAGHAEQHHQPLGVARQQLVQCDVAGMPARARQSLGDEADFAFIGGGERCSSSVRPPSSSSKRTRAAVSASIASLGIVARRARLRDGGSQLGVGTRRHRASLQARGEAPRRRRGPDARAACARQDRRNAIRHWPNRSRRRPRAGSAPWPRRRPRHRHG